MQAALRENYAAYPPLQPVLTHLHPAALRETTHLLLPTNHTFTLVDPASTPETVPSTDHANSITALSLTPSLILTAHRSGHLKFHSYPQQTTLDVDAAPDILADETVTTCNVIHSFRPFRDERVVSFLALDADCLHVAAASADGYIIIYRLDDRVQTHMLQVDGIISAVTFSNDCLLVALDDGHVHWFDLTTKRRTSVKSSSIHVAKINHIDVFDGGFVTAGGDAVLGITKFDRGFGKHQLVHAGETLVSAVVFADNVVTAGDKTVNIWDLEGTHVFKLEIDYVKHDDIAIVDMRQNGPEKLVLTLSDQTLLFVTVTSSKLQLDDNVFCGNLEQVYDVRALPNPSTHMALATNSNSVWIYDHSSSEPSKPPQWTAKSSLDGHKGIVLSLDCTQDSLDSVFLLSGSRDHTAKLWTGESPSFKCIATAEGHTDAVTAVALSPKIAQEGGYFVTASSDRTLKMWAYERLHTKQLEAKWTTLAHAKDINTVAISPDGKYIVTGGQDRLVKIWTDRGLIHRTCEGHKRGIWSVAFSKVDRVVVSASGDGKVKIWNVSDGRCLRTLEGHMGGVLRAQFISAGAQIISTGVDGLIKVWLAKTGECGETIEAHEDRVWGLHVINDGEKLVTGGADGKVIVWKDVTGSVRSEKRRKEEEQIVLEQRVMNAARGGAWEEAVRGGVDLIMTRKLNEVFTAIITSCTDAEAVLRKCVEGLNRGKDNDEAGEEVHTRRVKRLLLNCRDWIATGGTKSAALGLHVLQAVFGVHDVEQLCDTMGGDQRGLVEGLAAHVQRHHDRLAELSMKIRLFDYTLEQMGGLSEEPAAVFGTVARSKRKSRALKMDDKGKETSENGVRQRKAKRDVMDDEDEGSEEDEVEEDEDVQQETRAVVMKKKKKKRSNEAPTSSSTKKRSRRKRRRTPSMETVAVA